MVVASLRWMADLGKEVSVRAMPLNQPLNHLDIKLSSQVPGPRAQGTKRRDWSPWDTITNIAMETERKQISYDFTLTLSILPRTIIATDIFYIFQLFHQIFALLLFPLSYIIFSTYWRRGDFCSLFFPLVFIWAWHYCHKIYFKNNISGM